MKLVSKTDNKVVIEVLKKEIDENGFDYIWDKIRKVYDVKNYEIFVIEKSKKNKDIVFFELTPQNKE